MKFGYCNIYIDFLEVKDVVGVVVWLFCLVFVVEDGMVDEVIYLMLMNFIFIE